MRIANKYTLIVRNPIVQSDVELVSGQGTRRDPAEVSKIRPNQSGIDDPSLLIAFPAAEKEQAVVAYRASKSKTELPPLKKRVRVFGIAIESWVSSQAMIAEEIERRAMQIVGPRPRDHVNRPIGSEAGTEVKVHGGDLELLHYLLGKAHG